MCCLVKDECQYRKERSVEMERGGCIGVEGLFYCGEPIIRIAVRERIIGGYQGGSERCIGYGGNDGGGKNACFSNDRKGWYGKKGGNIFPREEKNDAGVEEWHCLGDDSGCGVFERETKRKEEDGDKCGNIEPFQERKALTEDAFKEKGAMKSRKRQCCYEYDQRAKDANGCGEMA